LVALRGIAGSRAGITLELGNLRVRRRGQRKGHPFGDELNLGLGEQLSPERLKYTGHERDDATNGTSLDYMHARFEMGTMGRFLSVDPMIAVARNQHQPQGWNRYAYALDNPIVRIDPDGRKDTIIFISMLGEGNTPRNIERRLNSAVKGTRYEGHIIIVGPGASRGALTTWLRKADSSDIVVILAHSGGNPVKVGGTMMGGDKHADPSTAITGKQHAQTANDGSAPT